jgi:hypothetical protein
MSFRTEFIFALVLIGLEIVGVLVYVILHSEWIASFYGDKLEKATIHIKNGKGTTPVDGKLYDIINGEYIYTFLWAGQRYDVK